MVLRFAYPSVFYISLPFIALALAFRLLYYKQPIYTFPLASYIKKHASHFSNMHKPILLALRTLSLIALAALSARPQWIDEKSHVKVDGVDMIIALDLSGSMQVFDDVRDQRPRIEVAKAEALAFVEKRPYDPIGLVLFGEHALSACPLTLDKKILKTKISEIKLGMISANGTALGTGLASAVNRLRNSKAKSKIVILLTDGVPSSEKISPEVAIELAKKFGIKVYTIGIGSPEGGYHQTPFGVAQANISLDMNLLTKIAHETGGKAFQARNPQEMRTIYNTIDSLEKTEIESPIYRNYYEAFQKLLFIVLGLIFIEFLLRFWLWKGLLT
jgi:Ca-activated chloride channel family protein